MAESIDPALLEQLIGDHAAALELNARSGNQGAEDCVQEAFVKLVGQRLSPTSRCPGSTEWCGTT